MCMHVCVSCRDISIFSYGCDKIPWQKQINKGRVYFDSRFEGTAMVVEESRWQKSQNGGVWGNGSHCVHTQEVETENLGARLAFSFLFSLRAQSMNCIIHIWDWVCLRQLTLSRNPLIDTPRDLFLRWPQVRSSWPSSPHITVEKNQEKQQAAFTPPKLTDSVLLAKYLLKDLPTSSVRKWLWGLACGPLLYATMANSLFTQKMPGFHKHVPWGWGLSSCLFWNMAVFAV